MSFYMYSASGRYNVINLISETSLKDRNIGEGLIFRSAKYNLY